MSQGSVMIEHLSCTGCLDTVGTARIDGDVQLVCHCTHVDGEISPVGDEDSPPARWEWVQNGGAPDV